MNINNPSKANIMVDKFRETKSPQADETAKLISSLITLFYSIQTRITSEAANDNTDLKGGDDDDAA